MTGAVNQPADDEWLVRPCLRLPPAVPRMSGNVLDTLVAMASRSGPEPHSRTLAA